MISSDLRRAILADVAAHNGCLDLKVTIHGKSAHAVAPETGHDERLKLSDLTAAASIVALSVEDILS